MLRIVKTLKTYLQWKLNDIFFFHFCFLEDLFKPHFFNYLPLFSPQLTDLWWKRDKINCLSIFQGLYLNVPNSLTQLTLDNLNIQKSQAPLKVKPLPKAFNKPNSLTGSFWAKPIEQNLYLITWLCCPVVLQILSYWEWAVAAPMLEIYPQSGLPKKIVVNWLWNKFVIIVSNNRSLSLNLFIGELEIYKIW